MLKSLTEIGKKICFSTKSAADLQFSDPVVGLQKYLAIPLFKSDEKPFQPTMEIMKNAQKLFHPQYNSTIQFLRGAIYSRDYPQTSVPEVAFLGQSNAGKSSLIKALFHQVPNIIVKTSKTPGHTKTINFFQVGNSFNLVDMPGYGMNQPKLFTEAVQGYLQERTNLNLCFLLIDGVSGITALDFNAIDMLEQYEKSFCFVLTKIDIATKSVLLKNLIEFINIRRKYSSPHCYPQPFLISSFTGEGITFLQAFIGHVIKQTEIPSEYVSLNIENFS